MKFWCFGDGVFMYVWMLFSVGVCVYWVGRIPFYTWGMNGMCYEWSMFMSCRIFTCMV